MSGTTTVQEQTGRSDKSASRDTVGISADAIRWHSIELLNAAKDDDMERIHQLLANPATDVNYKAFGFDNSPVIFWVRSIEALNAVLSSDPNLAMTNSQGDTLYHAEVYRGDSAERFKRLLSINRNLHRIVNSKGVPVFQLIIAQGRVDLFELLLNHAEFIGDIDISELLFAIITLDHCSGNNRPFLEKMLEYGLDINQQDRGGGMVYHYAARCQNLTMIEILDDLGVRRDMPDASGNTFEHYLDGGSACQSGYAFNTHVKTPGRPSDSTS